MSKIHVDFIRGKKIESTHQVKALVTNIDGKILLSTNNDNEFFFPRSSIKIFQAIPFAMSNAIKNYKLNNKIFLEKYYDTKNKNSSEKHFQFLNRIIKK